MLQAPTYPIVMGTEKGGVVKKEEEKKEGEVGDLDLLLLKCCSDLSLTRSLGCKNDNNKEFIQQALVPGLVAALHNGAYSTVRLTWATPSPKSAWNMVSQEEKKGMGSMDWFSFLALSPPTPFRLRI